MQKQIWINSKRIKKAITDIPKKESKIKNLDSKYRIFKISTNDYFEKLETIWKYNYIIEFG